MHALGIGELLWDILPDGSRLGGAPLNVLINLTRLGHQVTYVTGVGRDPLGDAALRHLEALGVDTSFVEISADHPTGTAGVELDADGVPTFNITRPAAYDAVHLTPNDLTKLAEARPRALVYGTLAQQTAGVRTSLHQLSTLVSNGIRLFDVNLRPGGWDPALVQELAEMATVIKLSEHEAEVVGGVFDVSPTNTESFCRELARRLGLHGVALTAGADGASVMIDNDFAHAPAPYVEVVDTVGSGDAFSAALIDGIARGADVRTILLRANALGALVASRPGATPSWTRDELAALELGVGAG
jgi:fructokinase